MTHVAVVDPLLVALERNAVDGAIDGVPLALVVDLVISPRALDDPTKIVPCHGVPSRQAALIDAPSSSGTYVMDHFTLPVLLAEVVSWIVPALSTS